DTHRYTSQIEEDRQDGIRAGVRGTPAFFINGVLLEGVASESDFERIINQVMVNHTRGRYELKHVEAKCTSQK
ncbi:MAG: hypothetical protein WCE52_18260, partial [Candidatus Acidiferrum sp.]